MLLRKILLLNTNRFERTFLYLLCLLVVSGAARFGYSQTTETQKTSDAVILESGKPIERELFGGEKHSYRINLNANQYAKIIVEQQGINVSARLLSADGKTITENDSDPGLKGQEIVEFTAKDSAVFTLVVWAKQSNAAAGRYAIRLEEIRSATDKDYALDEARNLNFEAMNLWRDSKYKQAQPLAERALAIREKESGANTLDFASSLVTLANITGDNGEYDTSESLYLRALAIKEKLLGKDDLSVSSILNNLGLLYEDKGDYVKAESLLRRALEIRKKTLEPNHLLIANVLNNLAGLSRIKGDEIKAAEFYRRALDIREKALPPDSPDVATSLMNLANIYTDATTAEPLYRRALAIREKVFGNDSPIVAETLYNLAVLFHQADDNIKAEPLAKRALAIFEKSLGAEHPRTGYALNLLATIYKNSDDYAQSEQMYRRAIAIKEKTQGANHPDLSGAYSNLANLYDLKGEIDKAVAMQSRANDILEFNIELNLAAGSEKQKLDYLNILNGFVDSTLRMNFQSAPDSEAAQNLGAGIILRRKGRVLDAMADNIGALRRRFNAQDQILLDNLDKINKRFSEFILNGAENETADEYRAKIKTLTDERDELEDKISRRAAGFYEKTQPVTLNEIQSRIPPDSALLEFTVYNALSNKSESNLASPMTEPHYAVYVLHNQGAVRGIDLGDAKQIDEAINAYREALRDPKRTDVQTLARVVDEKVMQPIRALLGDSKHLLVSPDGELNLIPFEALFDEKGRYLIENYSFTYLTSGRDLLRMQMSRESKNKTLIIAAPIFGLPAAETKGGNQARRTLRHINKRRSVTAARDLSGVYFAPLNGTAQEARLIQTLFPDATFLTGAQATETALKQVAAPRILHIATHGFFLEDENFLNDKSQTATRDAKTTIESENPLLRSGLALAGANQRSTNGDDGILTALEASGLNLWGTKLVVLSACDTGVGEIKNGEGVYGLRRAFTLAGTESLVMSLWSVSDYTTRELMTNYYKNLKQKMGRGAALRQAQLEMLKRKGREHPFYWAAFIESGEWANLDGKR
ncbi:MAG: CHAT domain-containing protein [Pyrinomonadaceae bacterium]